MSEREKLAAIHRWINETRRAGDQAGFVHAIEGRLESESDETARRVLNLELAGEYGAAERYRDAERIYLMLFSESPDEPMPLSLLAEQKLYHESAPADAMVLINRAIEAAFRSGNFRRHALGVKARIALELKKFSDVEDVLRRLLALRHDSRGVDVATERDFFDRLPPGAIDKALAREFDEYSRERPTRG